MSILHYTWDDKSHRLAKPIILPPDHIVGYDQEIHIEAGVALTSK